MAARGGVAAAMQKPSQHHISRCSTKSGRTNNSDSSSSRGVSPHGSDTGFYWVCHPEVQSYRNHIFDELDMIQQEADRK